MKKQELERILDALYAGYGHFQPQGPDDSYRRTKQHLFKVAIDILENLYPPGQRQELP